MADILIRNGLVVDGSGARRFKADVAIEGGRIAHVGSLEGAKADTVLDATDHIVAPGFVDMHSHSDNTLPVNPTADSLLHQGITTVVFGMCGGSPAPILPETREKVLSTRGGGEARMPYEKWSTYGSYLDYLREIGISPNAVPVVGQSTIRAAVMEYSPAAPTAAQLKRMRVEVAKAMDEGAIGISTGLIYTPGIWATTDELVQVTEPAGQKHGYYFTHIRGEANTLLEALTEAIEIGKRTGTAVEIGHFKAAGRANWAKAAPALELLDKARGEGLAITADMYPYEGGSSALMAMLPEWAQAGGKEAILKRLKDSATRKEMVAAMKKDGFWSVAEWDKVLIAGSVSHREYEGRYVAELAEAAHKGPYDWLFDGLYETQLDMRQITFFSSESNFALQLRYPYMMIGTDGSGLSTEGPLSRGVPHPRSYGTFACILGKYVREKGVLAAEEAAYRMSGLPAKVLGWTDRGLLQQGQAADVVVYNPKTVADVATYEKPHQYAVGIPHVLVNGKLVIRDGKHTGARAGKVLSRM